MSLCWLASYPKSGNTWLRTMLTVYLAPDRELDLGAVMGASDVNHLAVLQEALGLDPALLTPAELLAVRARQYRALAAQGGPLRCIKTHQANQPWAGGRLFDADTGRAIYLVRHPYDVAQSYAHYVAETVEEITRQMISPGAVFEKPGLARPRMLAQPMGSWADHVASWVERPALPLLTLRYEDMCADPAGALTEVVRFLQLPWSGEALQRALDSTRFERLQALEAQTGFPEKAVLAERFFRGGRVGEGREALPLACRKQLDETCAVFMARFDYDMTAS